MLITAQAFHVPKRGSSEAEYEDASFPADSFAGELASYRCAVADGATESAFARSWAELLVHGLGMHSFCLKEQQRQWREIVAGTDLPWYLEAKVRRGAHAALVALSLHDEQIGREPIIGPIMAHGTWRAFAIGDSCFFHVRQDELLDSGPLHASAEFDNCPALLSTEQKLPDHRNRGKLKVISGRWQSQDYFYLASDAMSQWLMAELEEGFSPWEGLNELEADAFPALIALLREDQRIHNDDTTLLRIEIL